MRQLTKEEAIAFCDSKVYENWTYRQIAEFQMEQDLLCVPFGVFHEAIEKTLGRPVFTHEFGFNREGLMKELLGGKEAPTFEEIVNLIPKEKRLVIFKQCAKQ